MISSFFTILGPFGVQFTGDAVASLVDLAHDEFTKIATKRNPALVTLGSNLADIWTYSGDMLFGSVLASRLMA
jgi:hypothetical protein